MQASSPKALVWSIVTCLTIANAAGQSESPNDSGIVEEAGVRLAQLDVTVSGPARKLVALGPDDFELTVADRLIDELSVDRICPDEPAADPTPSNYMLYFDHALLTMSGRENALRLARDLVPELLMHGARLTIVSNGRALTTLTELTSDAELLLAALDRMQADPAQWRFDDDHRHWNGDRSLRRLSIALAQLADLNPPKGVVFFAGQLGQDSAYPLVVEEAGAQGVRIYPVQTYTLTTETKRPEPKSGIVGQYVGSHPKNLDSGNRKPGQGVSRREPYVAGTQLAEVKLSKKIDLVQIPRALETLAAETGGRAFSATIDGGLLAERVHKDATCFYLLSYDPVGLKLDKILPVEVGVRGAGVKARARKTTLIQSQEARTKSRLLSAFIMPASGRSDLGLRGHLVPTGWRDGEYTALLQIEVPGSTLANAVWDLGASLLSRGGVVQAASRRVEAGATGMPVVLESEMSLQAAPWELISVAHETNREMASFSVIATDALEGFWPHPDESDAGVLPISVLQPARAAFVRDGQARSTGALARGPKQPVWADRPTVLLGLVCRGAGRQGPLRVESNLVGESPVAFPAKEIEFGDERCVQVRDLIPAGSMSAGGFTYELRVLNGTDEVSSGRREFFAVAANPQG